MTKARASSVAVGLCVVVWSTTGSLKILDPTPIKVAGMELDWRWSLVIGLFEVAIAIGLAFSRSRPAGRAAALLLIAVFMVVWSSVPPDCGCFGAVQLDRAGRTVLIGSLLTAHGAELLLSRAPRPSRRTTTHVA